MPKQPLIVPLQLDGSLQHYPDGSTGPAMEARFREQFPDWQRRWTDWKECFVFEATLRLDHFARGRSAAYGVFVDSATGAKYPMFLTFLEEVIKERGLFVGGLVHSRWTFAKRGQNYSIRLAKEGE